MGFEMTNYNAKDKPTGRILYTIKEVTTDNGATIMKMELQSFDAKDKLPNGPTPTSVNASSNEMMMDMTAMTAAQENPMLKDAKMTLRPTTLFTATIIPLAQRSKMLPSTAKGSLEEG